MTFGAWFRGLFSRERDESEHIDDEEVLRRVRVLDATALRSAIDESLRPLDMLNRPFHPVMRLAPETKTTSSSRPSTRRSPRPAMRFSTR